MKKNRAQMSAGLNTQKIIFAVAATAVLEVEAPPTTVELACFEAFLGIFRRGLVEIFSLESSKKFYAKNEKKRQKIVKQTFSSLDTNFLSKFKNFKFFYIIFARFFRIRFFEPFRVVTCQNFARFVIFT